TAGVAPASRPEVALVVVINNPKAGQHFGGSVAEDCTGCFTCSGGTPTVRLNRACLLIIYLLLLNFILKRILI
ncbi:hypothetical protein, partial [Enterobacter hormaechei]|uniref:hypothetical protein n=1 Tax=Enterobacter hormaechei TaxID=158836 RepID=UPI001141ACAA